VNKEIEGIIHFASDVDNVEISSLSVDQSVGRSGHEVLKIRFYQGNQHRKLFCKIYNNEDPLFNNKQLIRVESFALRRTHSVGIPGPQVIATDVSGNVLGKPLLITSLIEGVTLEDVLKKTTKSGQSIDNAISVIQEPLSQLGSITKHDSKFGPLFTPSWIGKIKDIKEFMKMGIYREFWRAGMLDEKYIFHSDWARGVHNWTSKVIEQFKPSKYQLCHGDFCANNIMVTQENGVGKIKLSAIVDWEYAHWSVPEVDIGDFFASLSVFTDIQYLFNSVKDFITKSVDSDLVKVAMVHRIMIQLNQRSASWDNRKIFTERINNIMNL